MARAVLIVDDDPEVLLTLRDALHGEPVQVDAAWDVASALAMLGNREYCGVVLDLVLRDSSGFDVLHHIRNGKIKVPVVLVTGKLPNYVREILDHELVKLVFAKPIEPRMLAAMVLALCGIGT